MKIKAIIRKDEGDFEFTANLTPDQHTFLLEYAITDLVRKGLVPFHTSNSPEAELLAIQPIDEHQTH